MYKRQLLRTSVTKQDLLFICSAVTTDCPQILAAETIVIRCGCREPDLKIAPAEGGNFKVTAVMCDQLTPALERRYDDATQRRRQTALTSARREIQASDSPFSDIIAFSASAFSFSTGAVTGREGNERWERRMQVPL